MKKKEYYNYIIINNNINIVLIGKNICEILCLKAQKSTSIICFIL